MALDASSTIADVKAAYYDSSDYDIVGDTGKAGDFVQACRIILSWPSKSEEDGAVTEFDHEYVETAMTKAITWLQARQANTQSAYTVDVSFAGFRA